MKTLQFKKKNFQIFSLMVLLAGLPLLSATYFFESNLGIPAGQQFVLGGGQIWKVKATLKNQGLSLVEIRVRDMEGVETVLDTVRPSGQASASFPARSAAVLRNLGKFEANLNVKISGPSNNLGMGYEDF